MPKGTWTSSAQLAGPTARFATPSCKASIESVSATTWVPPRRQQLELQACASPERFYVQDTGHRQDTSGKTIAKLICRRDSGTMTSATRRGQTAGPPPKRGQGKRRPRRAATTGTNAPNASQNYTGERSRRKREGRSSEDTTPAMPTDKPPVSKLPKPPGREQHYQLSNGGPQG